MKELIKKGINNPLISGSSVVFIGSFMMSIGNYVYNLILGRTLSVEDYGLVTSLSSIFILLGLFSGALTTIFVKFSAQYKGSENDAGLANLFSYGSRFIGIFSLIFLTALILLSPFIKEFLHVDRYDYIFYMIAASIFSLFLTLPLGILQGRMNFIKLSLANFAQPVTKIIVFLLFFSLGFSVLSPFIALSLSVLVPTIVLYIYFYFHFRKKDKKETFDDREFKKEFFTYSYTYFLTGAGVALLSNVDILLVRYLFDETTSGQYAALSLMGKAIFYLVSPINFAFFPLIAYKKERKERLFGTVFLAFSIVSLASLALSFIYFAFPNLILSIFFPSPEYKMVGNYLGFFSLYIFVFSLATLLCNFFLSIGKTGVYKISLFAAFAQIMMLLLFHNSLYQVIGGMFFSSLLFFILLLWYYVRHGKD